MKIGISLLLFTFIYSTGWGQDYLVLEKMGTKKRYVYYPNDNIHFQLVGEDSFRKEAIVALTDSAIIFTASIIPIEEIVQVKTPVTGWMAASGGTIAVAGVGYFLIDSFNQTVVAGNNFSVDKNVAITSAVMVGAGAAMVLFSSRKVKLKNNWRIRMVDIY